MTIKEDLDAELKNALRAKDRARLDVIRQIHTEVTKAMAEPGFSGDADDALYRRIIGGYSKKMDKARAEYESYGERGAAMAEKLAFETDYLRRWLPAAASADDIRVLVEAAIDQLEVSDPKQAGRVIGHVMKSNPGVDGALVNSTVREMLGA